MPVQYRMFYVRKLINMQEKEKGRNSASQEDQSSKFARGPAINRG